MRLGSSNHPVERKVGFTKNTAMRHRRVGGRAVTVTAMRHRQRDRKRPDIDIDMYKERRWVLLKIPRCDIDGVGEGK